MKNYLYGLFGCITALILYTFLLSLYSDYRAKAEVESWVFKVEILQQALEDGFQKTGKFEIKPTSKKINQNEVVKTAIFENGTIVVEGGSAGQLLVLIPKVENGKIHWRCYAGPDKARPNNCKS